MAYGELWADAYTAGLWQLNGNANDSSANANHGTVSGASLATALFGQGYSFNGSSNYISVADSVSLSSFSEITLELWLNPTEWSHLTNVTVLAKRASAVDSRLFLFKYGTTNTLNVDMGGNAERWDTGYLPPTGAWTYLVYTLNTSDVATLYVNGRMQNSTALDGNHTRLNSTATLYIGRDSVSGQYYYKGLIEMLRISTVARSAEHIWQGYAQMKGAYGAD